MSQNTRLIHELSCQSDFDQRRQYHQHAKYRNKNSSSYMFCFTTCHFVVSIFPTDGSSMSLGSLYKPNQLADLSTSDVQTILSSLATTFDQSTAMILGAKLPASTSLSTASYLFSSASISIFSQSSSSQLIDQLGNMDLNNAQPQRIGFLVQQIFSTSVSTSSLESILNNNTNSVFINCIPLSSMMNSGLNISSVPANQLPDSYVLYLYAFWRITYRKTQR